VARARCPIRHACRLFRLCVDRYDYANGAAKLRLCTNKTQDEVDAVLGAQYRVDALSTATGGNCTLTNPAGVIKAAAECVRLPSGCHSHIPINIGVM
jgi:hypothetical protein